MKLPFTSSPTQARQTKEQFANPDAYLDYELGKAVQELPPLYTRLVGITLSLAVFGAIAWAGLNKVDEVAEAHGKLILGEQDVQPVRAPSGGKIKYINSTKVKEGSLVQQGEILVVLNSESSRAEIETLKQQSLSIKQDIERATKAAQENQKARMNEAKIEYERLLNNFNSAKRKADKECPFYGGIPYVRCENAQVELNNARKSFEAQKPKMKQLEESYKTGALSELSKRREELKSVEGKIKQAINQLQNQVITSPIAGKVYNIKVNQGQGIVQIGEDLLSILPEGKQPLLEVDLPNQYKAFVHEKMKAKVKIEALNYQEFGTIDGEVIDVSPNAVTRDKDSSKEVYPTRIKLDSVQLKKRGLDKQLTAGMKAEGDIVMRQKTVLSLLLEPMMRKFDDVFSRK